MYRIKIAQDPGAPHLREQLLLETILQLFPELQQEELIIKKDDRGKPYLAYGMTGTPVHDVQFSISHSGSFWACAVGDGICGLDLQEMRAADIEKLAARFFLPEEAGYVRDAGLAGFYRIWTRREALAKYTGLGFFGMGEIRPLLTDETGQPARTVIWKDRVVKFEELEAPEGYYAVWCHGEA